MPKKKDQVFYQLTVTEKQLRLINTALGEYFRLGLNQWWDLADRLSTNGAVNPLGILINSAHIFHLYCIGYSVKSFISKLRC